MPADDLSAMTDARYVVPTPGVGRVLRESRKRAGLSQQALADALCVSESCLAGFEQERRAFRRHMLARLPPEIRRDVANAIAAALVAEIKRLETPS